jgi:hypothetical protein
MQGGARRASKRREDIPLSFFGKYFPSSFSHLQTTISSPFLRFSFSLLGFMDFMEKNKQYRDYRRQRKANKQMPERSARMRAPSILPLKNMPSPIDMYIHSTKFIKKFQGQNSSV